MSNIGFGKGRFGLRGCAPLILELTGNLEVDVSFSWSVSLKGIVIGFHALSAGLDDWSLIFKRSGLHVQVPSFGAKALSSDDYLI